ncbi:MAG: hypothetical protein JXB62_01655 [Pirellulales bacterium]|nr:hypothetical protein [Pirellulales bacterium]
MKRIGLLAVIILPLAGYLTVQAQQKTAVPPAEKTVTITESQFNELVERKVAQRLMEEQTALDEEVLKAKHWHTAIYDGVVYHVYTGPGKAMAVTWAPKPSTESQPDAGAGPEATIPPATSPPPSPPLTVPPSSPAPTSPRTPPTRQP